MTAPNRIIQLDAFNGTFLGGYTGYDMSVLWATVLQDYLNGYGHFASNSDHGWDSFGSPYMALVDKTTMEILSTDGMDLINNYGEATLTPCMNLAP